MAKMCEKINELKQMFNNYEIDLDKIDTNELQNIMIIFMNQDDTRMQGKVKYLMTDIIMIAFLSILARCDSWDEIGMFAHDHKEWLKKLDLSDCILTADALNTQRETV